MAAILPIGPPGRGPGIPVSDYQKTPLTIRACCPASDCHRCSRAHRFGRHNFHSSSLQSGDLDAEIDFLSVAVRRRIDLAVLSSYEVLKRTEEEAVSEEISTRELELMDAYWRAANYLSVGQIYLLDNPLLKQPLTREHIKPRLLGHWGTTPGLNFIYAHLNRVIRLR